MTKKIIVAAVILLVGAWAVKKTHVCNYATAWLKNSEEHVRGQIPREVQLKEIENEIAKMDRDYQKHLRVIADKMVSIKELNQEIAVAELNRKGLADSLFTLTKAIEAKEVPISYKDANYATVAKAEVKAEREFTTLQQLDKTLGSKKKLLEAEERNLDALKDHLDKLVAQRDAFKLRLTVLRANEAELKAVHQDAPPHRRRAPRQHPKEARPPRARAERRHHRAHAGRAVRQQDRGQHRADAGQLARERAKDARLPRRQAEQGHQGHQGRPGQVVHSVRPAVPGHLYHCQLRV